jgi:hypothetical protein
MRKFFFITFIGIALIAVGIFINLMIEHWKQTRHNKSDDT